MSKPAVAAAVVVLAVLGAACTGTDQSRDVPATSAATAPPPTVVTTNATPAPPTRVEITAIATPPATTYEVADAQQLASSIEIRAEEALTDYDAEREGDRTQLTVPEQVLFDFDESQLRADASGDWIASSRSSSTTRMPRSRSAATLTRAVAPRTTAASAATAPERSSATWSTPASTRHD